MMCCVLVVSIIAVALELGRRLHAMLDRPRAALAWLRASKLALPLILTGTMLMTGYWLSEHSAHLASDGELETMLAGTMCSSEPGQ